MRFAKLENRFFVVLLHIVLHVLKKTAILFLDCATRRRVLASVMLEKGFYDSRLAFRNLSKHLGFTTNAVLMFALGVGASTAIFSVYKAVVLNQLPYRDSERIVALAQVDSTTPTTEAVGEWTANEWRMRIRSLESISLYGDVQRTLVDKGEAEVLRGLRVNHGFFDALGVKMALGRSFRDEEDRWPRGNVVVLSNMLWERRFGSDSLIVGRILPLGGESYRVIGVLPSDFHPLRMSNPAEKPQFFMPLGYDPAGASLCRSCLRGRAIARVKPGVPLEAARAELNSVMHEMTKEHPSDYNPGTSVRVEVLRDRLIGPMYRALSVILGAVALVFLIACANIANLLLARATERSKEMALRAALGASRLRLAGHLIAESLLLSVMGGSAGVLLSWLGVSLLTSMAPRELPRLDEIRVDGSVLVFGFVVSLGTGFLVAIVPAWRSSRISLNHALKGGTRGGLRNLLVISEVALAFLLVVGTGLLGKSFLRLQKDSR